MSRKHYQAIADVLAEVVDEDPADRESVNVANWIAQRLADVFAADNPQFDRERFLKAGGARRAAR